MISIAVYGLSTEGYQLASTLALKGYDIMIIDENLQVAMQLKEDITRSHPTAQSLLEDETLIKLEPMDAALSKARVVFFAPKVRKSGEEAVGEVGKRVRDVAECLTKGATFIFNLPVGLGGNAENQTIIERVSGLNSEEEFTYVYAPIPPAGTISLVGSARRVEKSILEVLGCFGVKSAGIVPLRVAESAHLGSIISLYSKYTAWLELYRRIDDAAERVRVKKMQRLEEAYLDDLYSRLYDLKVSIPALTVGEPLLHIVSAAVRSIENYMRRVIDEVRLLMKIRELKASKTRIIVAWTIDRYEMRGDRIAARESLVDKLRDYIGDISVVEAKGGYIPSELTIPSGKTSIVLACSEGDFKASPKLKSLGEPIVFGVDLILGEQSA